MENPFRKRASENVDKSEAFLQLVSPEPIELALGDRSDELYDRLVYVLGTPGSGKTTLGRLFEFRNLRYLSDQYQHTAFRGMAKCLTGYDAIDEAFPKLIASRLTMDAEYRGILELPYDRDVRNGLLKNLIQARCVLMWLRALEGIGVKDSSVDILIRNDSPAAQRNIGAESVSSLREMAISVEAEVYDVIHALVPRSVKDFSARVTDPYEPLKYITGIEIKEGQPSEGGRILRPMLILDDVHELHSHQFHDISKWLLERKFGAARWMMGRMDTLSSSSAFGQLRPYATDYDLPGYKRDRDYIILFTDQVNSSGKRSQKKGFQSIAKDISKRYLEQMSVFRSRQHTDIAVMLQDKPPQPTSNVIKSLEETIRSTSEKLRIRKERVSLLQQLIDEYESAQQESQDVRLMMLLVLMHRYSKRTPQQALFEEAVDLNPNKPISVDASVIDAARLRLMHEFKRPFYYGFETLAAASGHNVEQYLQLASELVDQLELRIVRKKSVNLEPNIQHEIVTRVAVKAYESWDFPLCDSVRKLVDFIAAESIAASLLPNAPLGPGANAYGIPQTEFQGLEEKFHNLDQVLHYAVAYNAIRVVKDYNCKNQVWTLLELGSFPVIKYGLTLKHGGFVEGSASKLDSVIGAGE